MKKLLLGVCVVLFGITSYAYAAPQSNGNSNTNLTASDANSNQGQALLVGGTGNGAGLGNNNSTNTAVGSDLSKAVGAAFAPALTTTLTETCMGSTSVGGGFSGGSFSFGTTWRDSACVRRLDAREIKTFGDIQASKEIMCDSDLVREAFKRVGRPCAEDGGIYTNTPTPVVVVSTPAVDSTPVATDVEVHDDQDSTAQRTKAILDKADADRAIMKEKYGF